MKPKVMNLRMSRICLLWSHCNSIWRGHECVSNSQQDIWCNTRNLTLWRPQSGNSLVQTDFPVSWVCDIWYVAGLSGRSHTYVNTVTVTCWWWTWAERDVRGQCWLSMCDRADEMNSPMFYSSDWLWVYPVSRLQARTNCETWQQCSNMNQHSVAAPPYFLPFMFSQNTSSLLFAKVCDQAAIFSCLKTNQDPSLTIPGFT